MKFDRTVLSFKGDNEDEAKTKDTVYRIKYREEEAPDLEGILKNVLHDTVSVTKRNGIVFIKADVYTRWEFGGWHDEFVENLLAYGYNAEMSPIIYGEV